MTYEEVVKAKGYEPETKKDAFDLGCCAIISQFAELLGHNSLTFEGIKSNLPKILGMKKLK